MTMQMVDIRKQSLTSLTKVEEIISSLATRAKELLGYDVLAKQTNVLVELTPLQAALKDLDIELLNRADVMRYQKELMIERAQVLFAEWLKEKQGKSELHGYDTFRGPAWVRTKIAEYRQPVPEFVLAKAVQIKERFPECEIQIEHFEDHPDPFLVVEMPDSRPYYAAKESYWVEVWAEPKFEGELRAGQDDAPLDDSGIPF